MKMQLPQVIDDLKEPTHADSKFVVACSGEDQNLEMHSTNSICVNEEGVTCAKSVPNSPLAHQKLNNILHLRTPPSCAGENQPQHASQNLQFEKGPKLFVSEMLINQRELYHAFESLISAEPAGTSPKFQTCETSLEIPDIAFSATSCALVFNNSEFWNNVQVRTQMLVKVGQIEPLPLPRGFLLTFQLPCKKFFGC
jgi:hypothetical protein